MMLREGLWQDVAGASTNAYNSQMNYEVQAQEYEVEGVRSANLEISVRGNRYPDQILLIGAHYDSVYGSPGANDNASGVAALLELSRLFKSASPSRSLRFVAFVNEEPPFFLSRQQGSMRYASEAPAVATTLA